MVNPGLELCVHFCVVERRCLHFRNLERIDRTLAGRVNYLTQDCRHQKAAIHSRDANSKSRN